MVLIFFRNSSIITLAVAKTSKIYTYPLIIFRCLKVTTAIQKAVKARSHRSAVYPRHVVPRNAITTPRKHNSWQKIFGLLKDAKTKSNYRYAFNDPRWPDMWYFVSNIEIK